MIDLFIIVALIFFYGWLSLIEAAYLSVRKARLEAEAPNQKTLRVLKLLQLPALYTSLRILTTITALTVGFLASRFLYESLPLQHDGNLVNQNSDNSSIRALLFFAVIVCTILLGELFPKKFSPLAPERIALGSSRALGVVMYLAWPFYWVASTISRFMIDIFGLKPAREREDTEEEVMAILSEASDTGDVEKEEKSIVESVFVLGDATAGAIMTNKPDLIYVDLNKSLEENTYVIENCDHYVVPVCEGSLDNVVGVLNIKSIIKILLKKGSIDLLALMEKPLFVPENMKALKLFQHLKSYHSHMAIVVDEYGSVKGAVTANDLYKVLVKDIYLEDKETDNEIFIRADGSALVDGLVSLDTLFKHLKITEPEDIEQQGFYTLGGLMLYISKNIPKAGDAFSWQGYMFEVMDMDGKRVDKVLIKKQLEEEEAIPAQASAKG